MAVFDKRRHRERRETCQPPINHRRRHNKWETGSHGFGGIPLSYESTFVYYSGQLNIMLNINSHLSF